MQSRQEALAGIANEGSGNFSCVLHPLPAIIASVARLWWSIAEAIAIVLALLISRKENAKASVPANDPVEQ